MDRAHRLRRLRALRNIRAAVAGTGFIGVVHVEALRRLGIEVAGIVGSSHERAVATAKAKNLPDAYESFEAMLADDKSTSSTSRRRTTCTTARSAPSSPPASTSCARSRWR